MDQDDPTHRGATPQNHQKRFGLRRTLRRQQQRQGRSANTAVPTAPNRPLHVYPQKPPFSEPTISIASDSWKTHSIPNAILWLVRQAPRERSPRQSQTRLVDKALHPQPEADLGLRRQRQPQRHTPDRNALLVDLNLGEFVLPHTPGLDQHLPALRRTQIDHRQLGTIVGQGQLLDPRRILRRRRATDGRRIRPARSGFLAPDALRPMGCHDHEPYPARDRYRDQ